ncbi:glycosyltransferase family 4 protein [Leucobacter sp. CSA1]|uniref:Glycosyltransferase family 4 protein n=1 Tax=Leucobacter chromiisoli TaxID=2796471 RepID=A0A934UW34_9MICO|nr:glycosyltransferase family 4 protein [Leucobacter chromiisoli]MBK0419853.1 glycosyltransferase family 4 protein [Leucobacter chromiisoli]
MTRRIGFARWRSDSASGGNRYDDDLSAAFRELELDVREYPIAGSWPTPEPDDRRAFARVLAAERHWLVDNIVASAAPEAVASAVSSGCRVTVLMHYFPADDPSLSAADRARLAEDEAAALAAASEVVTSSEWAAREVAARYGRPDAVPAVPGVGRAPRAPGSLGDPATREGESGGESEREIGESDTPMLLWLGRVTETKDPLTLVEALGAVRDLSWTACLVGPDTVDEALGRRVRDRLAELGIASRVEMPGMRGGEALAAIWARADLLVHTSRTETYGMVVSEALARGVPSVVSEGTGAVEAQRGAGATFPVGDARALAAELRAWLDDPALRARWRRDARERREHLPAWSDTARTIAEVLTR